MPVDITFRDKDTLYQREQYAKGGIGRSYWDYRDTTALSFLNASEHCRIIDIGCGEGITLDRLNRVFPAAQCLGIDGLRENLPICSGHGLPVIGASVYELPFPDASFHHAVFFEVVEHLTKPEAAIREIQRILKPGGTLIVIFPHDSLFRIARILTLKIREARFDPGHVRQWTPGDMKNLLEACGFTTVVRKSIPFLFWQLSLHHIVVSRKDS